MLEKSLKVITLLIFSINIYLFGLSRGWGSQFYEIAIEPPGLARIYCYICFFLLIYFVAQKVRNKWMSHTICISSLTFIIYQYKNIYLYTKLMSKEGEPVSSLLRESIPLDILSFSLILILLIYQIAKAFYVYFNWKRSEANVN